ncbi:MAG: hypothetical protein HRT89_10835 [Lentisphaeria bacterium]|nr:hypothetical protein [Lentisphaeria bacterium]
MNNYIMITYSLYIVISVGITIWVGRTLYKNGRIFLVDSYAGNIELADSVNHLLVVGFYLINIGFVSLALKSGLQPTQNYEVFEVLSGKVGKVLLVLGAMHFMNLIIFSKMRKRAMLFKEPPPVPADRAIKVEG